VTAKMNVDGRHSEEEHEQHGPDTQKREHEEPEMHRHTHAHDGLEHRHPHHHTVVAEAGPVAPTPPLAHEHAHALTFERFTYVCSPVHDLDPRAKTIAVLLVVIGIVLGPPPQLAEIVLLAGLYVTVTLMARLPVRAIFARSFLVLPVAAGIALFAPLSQVTGELSLESVAEAYQTGWVLSWSIVSKAWLSACAVILLAATTPPPLLFKGLGAMHVPSVFITMLTFLYRYAEVLRGQLSSMRRAIASRGPSVHGTRLVRLYGNLAGAMFVRAYERGERIHAAMLSRGYDGTLPTAEPLRMRPVDALVLVTALLAAAALILY